MCGFYCVVSFDKVNLEASKKSLDLIAHRGPDSQKYFFNNEQNIFMGFNRLSIIDLSIEADQPMIDKDSQRAIVFNGEIYNHNEIRDFLKTKNYSFETTSDTEVILKAYDFWKDDFIEQLEGMFSFVIYDPLENNIFFARDRAGEKPLYFYSDKTKFYLSSEIKPIHHDSKNNNISIEALNHYFEIGYTPKHSSILEGIQKLRPGHKAKLDLSSLELNIEKYWDLDNQISKPIKKVREKNSYYIDKLEILLGNAVEKQLAADVPVGMMLSGGVDSSLIVAMASKYLDK